MYAWRSQRTRLKLRLCVEGLGYWRWCEPFGLSYGTEYPSKTEVRSIDHGTHVTTLVITIKRMDQSNGSNCSQYHVNVSGLISTASLLRDHLEVRAVLHKHGAALAAAATVSSTSTHDHHQQQHRTILGSFCVAPSFLLQPEYVQGIKIRLLGIGTPWSGDIPLSIEKVRRNSVLVRVPLKEKGQCLTIWCRVVEECLGNERTRCLLVFSPMYMSRSLLPNPISLLVCFASSATAAAANTKENLFAYEVTLPGKEEAVQLETPGPSDQKYSLSFQVVQGLPPSDPVLMSWGTIEKIRDKSYETPSIDDVLSDIASYRKTSNPSTCDISFQNKQSSKLWPYLKEYIMEWAPSIQPRTDVQIRFVQFHPLCNTLCVDVVPWCLLVNMTGIPILIKDEHSLKESTEGSVYQVVNKSVFVPPTSILTSTFNIGLLDDDGKEWFSPPLQMTNQQWHFKRSVLMPALDGMIPVDGITHTHIICGAQICYFTIQSQDEHGIRVVSVKPTFQISNCLLKPIAIASICSPNKEMSSQDYVNFLGQDLPPSSNTSEEAGIKTESLLYWQIIGELNSNPIHGFQQVAFSSYQHWSTSLSLGRCIDLDHEIRISVSLPKNILSEEYPDKNILFTPDEVTNELIFVSLHQKEGIVYLLLQNDEQPQYIIHNGLKVPLCFVEAQTGDNKYVPSLNLPSVIHKINGRKSYLYSSVFASANLSKVESMDNEIQMAFSAIPKDRIAEECELVDQSLEWSEWFDLSNSNRYLQDYFIRIPGHGDVSIQLEPLANTCHVYIEPISQLEVPAREIRSRITASPQVSPPYGQLSNKVKSENISSSQLRSIPMSPATSDTSEVVDTSTNGEESFITIPALDKSNNLRDGSFQSVKSPATVYESCETSINQQVPNTSWKNETQATCFFDEICLILR